MPLMHGHSREVVSRNIKELVGAGHDPKQAIAISLANARKSKKMANGGKVQADDETQGKKTVGDVIGYPKNSYSDGGQVIAKGGMEDMPEETYGSTGDREDESDVYEGTMSGGLPKDEPMSHMDDKGPEDYQRSLNEIREDGEYYPSEVANPNEMEEAKGFAAALRKMANSTMSPENYAMGGLVQDGPSGDEPVGDMPEEEMDDGKEDKTISTSNGSPQMKEPSGMGLSEEAMEALRMKKKNRRFNSYDPSAA